MNKTRYSLRLIGIGFVLLLAAFLRITYLETRPGWYTDEGTHLEIARQLIDGRWQYFAINQSTLLFAKLPVFEWLVAGMLRIVGPRMLALRLLTAWLGILCCALVYALALHLYRGRSKAMPVIAALLMAVFPQAVVYSRLGFSYNLVAVCVLLALVCLLRGLDTGDRRWLVGMSAALGIGALTDLMMLTLIPVFVLALVVYRPRALVWSLPLMALPWALFAGWMLATAPDAFRFDMAYTLGRVGGVSLLQQSNNMLNNVLNLARMPWIVAGAVGLLVIPVRRVRWLLVLLLWLTVIALGRVVALYQLSFYYMIPLLPLLALGLASLIDGGARLLTDIVRRRTLRPYAVGAVTVIVALVGFGEVMEIVRPTREPEGEWGNVDIFLTPAYNASQAAAFLNERLTPCDVVMASPTIGWLIEGAVTDIQMPTAYAGFATPHLPDDIPADRWVFDSSIDQVSYALVDDLWYLWGWSHIPGFEAWLFEVEEWPQIFAGVGVWVYRNPDPTVGQCVA